MTSIADKRIVILTGAGVSAESGLGTFRDKDGLWTKYDLNEVATPEGFARNPKFVHEFYNQRRQNLVEAEPNPAHHALGRLEAEFPGNVLVVTQNIDRLHEMGGSRNVLHMHGEMLKSRCDICNHVIHWEGDLSLAMRCEQCGSAGAMRPHVVWFGEMPFYMDDIERELSRCDLFLSIGTSGNVYPAAGFISQVRHGGRAHTVELNLEPSEGSSWFQESILGPATEVVPAYVDRLLAEGW
ncbi:MAG: NAD-dependent deacylase [Rhodospirillales bacterium]|nr:NAD-dependent deacylase [Rhodospirillales bacterium]